MHAVYVIGFVINALHILAEKHLLNLKPNENTIDIKNKTYKINQVKRQCSGCIGSITQVLNDFGNVNYSDKICWRGGSRTLTLCHIWAIKNDGPHLLLLHFSHSFPQAFSVNKKPSREPSFKHSAFECDVTPPEVEV